MKPKIKQCWTLWIRRVGCPGYGRGFEGTYAEARAQAHKEAGRGGRFTVKGAALPKPATPKRRHGRPLA